MWLIYREEGTGRDGYKLSKRRAMGDDEGDDDHYQQLYTYGTGKRLTLRLLSLDNKYCTLGFKKIL